MYCTLSHYLVNASDSFSSLSSDELIFYSKQSESITQYQKLLSSFNESTKTRNSDEQTFDENYGGAYINSDGNLVVLLTNTSFEKSNQMRLKDAGFPAIVLEQTPKYLRNSKVPVVKAKIGPKVMSLMCEPKIYDLIPLKKEVKAVMNGIYIIDVKGARGGLAERPEKVGFFKKMKAKLTKKEA